MRVIPPAPKNQKLTASELTRTFAAVLLHRRGCRWRLRGLGVGKKPDPVSEANLWQNKILRAFAVVFVLLVLIGGSVLWFVKDILAGQPEPPLYFATMKRVNRDGLQ